MFGLLIEPPSLEDAGKMLNETVVLNNPIQLECKAAGNPLPGRFTCGLPNLTDILRFLGRTKSFYENNIVITNKGKIIKYIPRVKQ